MTTPTRGHEEEEEEERTTTTLLMIIRSSFVKGRRLQQQRAHPRAREREERRAEFQTFEMEGRSTVVAILYATCAS